MHWGVVLHFVPHGQCRPAGIFLLDRGSRPCEEPPVLFPPVLQSRAGTPSQPSSWGAPDTCSDPGSVSNIQMQGWGKGGVHSSRDPLEQEAGPASAFCTSWVSVLSIGWPLTPAILGPLRDGWGVGVGAWEDPGIVPCTHNKQQNHRLPKITCLKFSNLGWAGGSQGRNPGIDRLDFLEVWGQGWQLT